MGERIGRMCIESEGVSNLTLEDKPRKLNIEVTTKCNLECAMCMRRVWNEDSGDMSLDTFKALVPVFPEIETINIIGIGEPLLNENIFEMIELGKQNLPPHGTISMTTNASLIDEVAATKIIKSGLTHLVVSLDSVNADTYNRIRSGANYNDVLKNIETKEIGLELMDGEKPGVIRLGNEYVYVVLPMQIT